jgi:hypothetical protein
MAIKSVKVWQNPARTETRIYVAADDGREGCRYMTTTHWHKRGDIDGQLTEAEWAEAKELSVWENDQGKRVWHTVYEDEITARYNGPEEDARADLEALNSYRQPNMLLGSDLG